ncbi:daptomycin-sensing surface protein LiaX [Marinilactibacillus kalidii]|uniref:daptomycin-sensing surface protein LiaX n=1 Tax=Marinilactibacillus kalidii TaxID=2820274 RepID=UPI001ABE2DA7|nr:daptomycin-sensing surface protein LiaX [Marinilactibacillus kalidii]
MQERERILELVKNGVISTQEGLDLLESLVKKENKQNEDREFEQTESPNVTGDVEEPIYSSVDENKADDETEKKAAQNDELEKELETLATEINQYSVELDQVNNQLSDKKRKLDNKKAELNDLREGSKMRKSQERSEIQTDLANLEKELSLIQKIDELDNTAEVAELKADIQSTRAALEKLEARKDPQTAEQVADLEAEVETLEAELEEVQTQKTAVMKQLHATKMKQWTNKAKQVSDKLELPENWKDDASETLTKAGKQLEASGKELGKFIRESVSTSMKSEKAQSVKGSFNSALENFDWKDINIRVPKLASTNFENEWTFENTTASILDFKLANGKLKLKASSDDTIKISAKVKIYGKIDEETPLAAFEERSQIEVDEDRFIFHVPNKRIEAIVTISLPKRVYDYTSIKLLNGDVQFKSFEGKDVFVKSTNGNMAFKNTNVVMLEVKGTNGTVQVQDSDIRDFLVSTVSGSVIFNGSPLSADVSTTNGEVKLTLNNKEMTRIKASSVNGNVKIAIPKSLDIEGEAKTVFGEVKSRLTDIDVQSKQATKLKFNRIREGKVLQLTAQTTSGNILLKDSDKS